MHMFCGLKDMLHKVRTASLRGYQDEPSARGLYAAAGLVSINAMVFQGDAQTALGGAIMFSEYALSEL